MFRLHIFQEKYRGVFIKGEERITVGPIIDVMESKKRTVHFEDYIQVNYIHVL